MLKIERQVLEQMIRDARARAPIEACGYLGGSDGVVRSAHPLTNVDNSDEHFSFDPEEQFAAVRAMRERGEKLMAVYHSHPRTPARPSAEDIRLAYDPSLFYLIVSLAGAEPDVRAFRIVKGEVTPVEIQIVDESEEGTS